MYNFKIIKKLVFIACLLIALFASAHFAMAAVDTGLNYAAGTGLSATDPRVVVANIIRIALGFLGIIAVGLIIYAGWLWMTAGGEADKIEKAKKILTGAVIGLIIILASFAIASFILNSLLGATTGGQGDGTICNPACSAGQYCCNSSCQAGPCGTPYGGGAFGLTATRPGDQDINVARNVTVKAFFNGVAAENITQQILDNNFKMEKIADIDPANSQNITALGEALDMGGMRDFVNGRWAMSYATTTACGDEKNTLGCFPAWSKFKVKINGLSGIISAGGQSLSCGFNAPCEFVFSTGNLIDTAGPEAGIVPAQICQTEAGVAMKAGANTVTGWGRDDLGIADLVFYQQKQDGAETMAKQIAGNGKTYQSAEHVYDTTAMKAGDNYIFKIKAHDVANQPAEDSFTAKIRPGHCCNGIKDLDEADVDCGGECGACDGQACANDLSVPATCNNSLCASQFCTAQNSNQAACAAGGYGAGVANCCLCQRLPVITGIFPAGGFCENDVNKACLADSDCGGSVKCGQTTPNGAAGNFVTIIGKYFGAQAGKVYFKSGQGKCDGHIKISCRSNDDCDAFTPGTCNFWQEAKLANDAGAGNSQCAHVWSDTQIIAIVPVGAATGPIKVEAASGFSDDSLTNPRLDDFLINTIARPGLCQLAPASGKMNDTITYGGVGLTKDNQAYFGDWSASTTALSSVFTDVRGKQGAAQVPNIQTGKTTSFVADEAKKVLSNYLEFQKTAEPYAGPLISSFDPVQGAAGQYITIRGQGFGAAKGTSEIYFGPALNDKKASYTFPEVCADSVWSDKQVIVKAPAGLANGDYVIYMKIAKSGGQFWEIDSSDLSPAAFTADSTLPLAPSLCKLDPIMGQRNSQVSLWGEYFGDQDANSQVRFQLNHNQSGSAIAFWGIDTEAQGNPKPDKAETTVHQQAVTGPVRAVKTLIDHGVSKEAVGNGLNFTVGICKQTGDCGADSLCCSTGTPYAGQCKSTTGGKTEQDVCFPQYKSSVYQWTFSTTYLPSVGDPCYNGAVSGTCDASQSRCEAAGLVCQPRSCTCAEHPAIGDPCYQDGVAGDCSSDDNQCDLAISVCNTDECICKSLAGGPCYKDGKAGSCDINKDQCDHATTYCDTASCICQPKDCVNQEKCNIPNPLAVGATFRCCSVGECNYDGTCDDCPANSPAQCGDGSCCKDNSYCRDTDNNSATPTVCTAPDSCAGYGNQCAGGYYCPNSLGLCSSYAGGLTAAGDCGDDYCHAAYPVICGSGQCVYDQTLNKCRLKDRTCDDLAASESMKFDAEEPDAASDFDTEPASNFKIGIVAEGSNKIYAQNGFHNLFSTDFVPININTTYYIFGRFKSAGTGKVCVKNGTEVIANSAYKTCTNDANICDAANGESCVPFKSRLYFGLAPYDENQKLISAEEVLRKGSDATIASVSDTQIVVKEAISGWNDQTTVAGVRSLGFYYDGDTSHRVDYVFSWYPTPCGTTNPANSSCFNSVELNRGAYNGTGINGSKVINLNHALPQQVLDEINKPGAKVVVKNHYGGNTYLYAAAVNSAVPWEWENLAYNRGGITGQSFGNGPNAFRMGTKYVKLVLLVNYRQTENEKIQFDDIVFAEQQCRTVSGYSTKILQINSGGNPCPGGTFLDANGWCSIIRAGGQAGDASVCELNVCPSGSICQAKQCLIDKNVCASGASCVSGKCQKASAGACECCCRLDYSAQDCCYPLKCQGNCGSDRNADTNTLGYCTGCTVKIGGTVNQAASNRACNCKNASGKFCDTAGAGGDGICQDCSGLSGSGNCTKLGVGTCCVDAMGGNACRGGTETVSSGVSGDTNAYCSYYPCDNSTATCGSAIYKTTLPSYRTAAGCSASCTLPPAFGQTCFNYSTTQPRCDTDICTGFNCLNEDGTGPQNPPNDCGTCCCDPAANPDKCTAINTLLTCKANQSPCSGDKRGLCCGCTKDGDCGSAATTGCGADACCHARPSVESAKPMGPGICRNALIQATFNQYMRPDSFANNIMVAGSYGADPCPSGTTYLTAAYRPSLAGRIKAWLAKAPLVNKLFAQEALALNGNYCVVPGAVDGYNIANKTVVEYKLRKMLDAGRRYYVIIKGDADTSDAIKEGVLAASGVGMNSVGAPLGGDAYENPAVFNGQNFKNAKIWYFTTKESSDVDSGICRLASVAVNPASYLFKTSVNDTKDDNSQNADYDTVQDSDKIFRATGYSADGQALSSIAGLYSWEWSWAIEDQTVVKFKAGENATDNVVIVAQNIKDASTLLDAKATIAEDSVMGTKGAVKEGQAEIYVFLCDNPWPVVKADGTWAPWTDLAGNCAAGGGDCYNTNFSLHYCRDAGEAGTADDLPALSESAIIRGASAADDIVKELYFFRGVAPDVASGLSVNALRAGGKVSASWNPARSAAGYKLYYGTASGQYNKNIDIKSAATNYTVTGLVNGQVYYFAVTAYNNKAIESGYSNEASTTPADTLAPATPRDLSVTVGSNQTTVAWAPNIDDTVSYKVYYGASRDGSGAVIPGASVKVDKSKCSNALCSTAITGLASGTTYYFAVSALDAQGNESGRIQGTAATADSLNANQAMPDER
ncbi:MAG: fibronectin type III domain-containing protein [Patescibacteria group bacterium]|nr:fibronectin type III domain-containing protein [Patescibacteria group bacterium]